MKNKRLEALVVEALRAQAAGVVLRLKDWNAFSTEEQGAWIAARRVLAGKVAPPEENVPAEDAEPEVDQDLRSVLERGADLMSEAR